MGYEDEMEEYKQGGQARAEGLRAFHQGLFPENNPHPPDSDRGKAWDEGWSAANELSLEKLAKDLND